MTTNKNPFFPKLAMGDSPWLHFYCKSYKMFMNSTKEK